MQNKQAEYSRISPPSLMAAVSAAPQHENAGSIIYILIYMAPVWHLLIFPHENPTSIGQAFRAHLLSWDSSLQFYLQLNLALFFLSRIKHPAAISELSPSMRIQLFRPGAPVSTISLYSSFAFSIVNSAATGPSYPV